MISDSIWTDPKLAHLSSEDLLTNVMLLTNRDSNVIGVYQTMWRSVGAGLGWTEQQMLTKARDLAIKGIIAIDEREGWVWVKNWWNHNSLRAAFVGNVAKKARLEFSKVPAHWRDDVYKWLAENDEEGVCESLRSPSEGACRTLESSPQGSDGNHTPNLSNSSTTTTTTTTTTTPTPTPTPTHQVRCDKDSTDIKYLVEAAVWAAAKTRVISNEAGFRHKVTTRIQTSGANPADLQSLNAWRSAQATGNAKALAFQKSNAEIERFALQQACERERLEAAFEALDQPAQTELIKAFEAHLAVISPPVQKLLKKHGISSPVVRATFIEFIKVSSIFETE